MARRAVKWCTFGQIIQKGILVKRPSYSAVTSTLALVVALTGSAYAASVADNSVDTRHLKNEAVTDEKLAESSVTSKKIKNDAVKASKIADGQVKASHLASTAKGVFEHDPLVQTPANVTLPPSSNNSGFGSAEADCPAGSVVTGGGYWISHSDVEVLWSKATDSDTWQVMARNPSSGTDRQVVAHAVCVKG